MVKQKNGVYRWTYEMNLYRSPTMLITVLKGLSLSFGIVWLFVFLISMDVPDFWWKGFLSLTMSFSLLLLAVLVLGTMGYYLNAFIQGGRYSVVFEMDEKGVKHKIRARQLKRAKVVAVLAALMGLLARKPAIISAGILAGSRASLYSIFASVKKITAVKARNVIYLDARLNHNQIYVEDADFDEVYDFIAARCVNAKGRGRRKTRKG